MIKNLILDYNGVISNDFDLVFRTSMEIFKTKGLKTLSFVDFKSKFEIPVTGFWKKVSPNTNFDELNKQYFEIYNSFGSPKPYPNSKTVLDTINSHQIKLIILSSHRLENIISELKSFQIDPSIFSKIYSEVKDKIEVINNLVQENNLNPKETAYVGDTEHDIQTGKSANLITIASLYGYRTRDQLKAEHPDYMINDIEELKDIILTSY